MRVTGENVSLIVVGLMVWIMSLIAAIIFIVVQLKFINGENSKTKFKFLFVFWTLIETSVAGMMWDVLYSTMCLLLKTVSISEHIFQLALK